MTEAVQDADTGIRRFPDIEVEGKRYARFAIKTHFVKIGEDYIELVKRYVGPHWQPGDLLSSSEKIISLCQGRVVYERDVQPGLLARFLSKFASGTPDAFGVWHPNKMQFAINLCGAPRVLLAAICGGLGKLVGRKGIFYEMTGREVAGLDGFYDKSFSEYGKMGIRIPEDPSGVCDEIERACGIPAMIVDANYMGVEILGKGSSVAIADETLCALIADNPAGQDRELTPFILIRPLEK